MNYCIYFHKHLKNSFICIILLFVLTISIKLCTNESSNVVKAICDEFNEGLIVTGGIGKLIINISSGLYSKGSKPKFIQSLSEIFLNILNISFGVKISFILFFYISSILDTLYSATILKLLYFISTLIVGT